MAAGGEDDLVTVFSLAEQRVVAWCEGHTSWVTAVRFDPWCASIPRSDVAVPSKIYWRRGFAWHKKPLKDLLHPCTPAYQMAASVFSCLLQTFRIWQCFCIPEQGYTYEGGSKFWKVNKQRRHGCRQRKRSFVREGSSSLRHNISRDIPCTGLPHLHVGRQHSRVACTAIHG